MHTNKHRFINNNIFIESKSKYRDKYYSFIENNLNKVEGIVKFEKFSEDKYILISKNCEEYNSGYRSKRRFLMFIISDICTIITVLRFSFSVIINREWIRQLTYDFGYVLNESSVMFSTAMSFLAFAIYTASLVYNYQNFKKKLNFYSFLHSIKYKTIKYPLNRNNLRKWSIKFSILTKYLLNKFYYLLYSVVFIFQFYLIYLKYFDQKSYLSVIKMIFWNLIYSIFLVQNCGILFITFIAMFESALYLKYRFNEINTKITVSLKYFNLKLLLQSIEEHNYIEIINNQLNNTFKFILFIITNKNKVSYSI